jgi:hypothetical protein
LYDAAIKKHDEFKADFQYIREKIYGLETLRDVITYSDYLQNTKKLCSDNVVEVTEEKDKIVEKLVC